MHTSSHKNYKANICTFNMSMSTNHTPEFTSETYIVIRENCSN